MHNGQYKYNEVSYNYLNIYMNIKLWRVHWYPSFIERGITGLKQTWEIGRFSTITRRYVGKREEKKSLQIMKSC